MLVNIVSGRPCSHIGNSIPSNFDWITFDQIFSQPPKSGVYVPSKMRGDGFPMVNTGDLFKEDIITNNEH